MNKLFLLTIPDIALLGYLLIIFFNKSTYHSELFLYVIPAVGVFLLLKIVYVVKVGNRLYFDRIDLIKKIIGDFKKGRYSVSKERLKGRDELAKVSDDLTVIGKHFEDIVTSQRNEIEKLREMYNNVVLTMSSYFLVLDERQQIIFANESFCNKFQYDLDSIYGKNIDSIFLFLTSRVKDAMVTLSGVGESVILEKTHLLSRNRISVIADIKMTRMIAQGRRQITMVMDDITGKLKKDYQMSLISQISESIQKDEEIDKVLYTILTGATSGSGLGFNRATLFLADDKENTLVGRMAVGPDNMEEAIEVWSSMPTGSVDLLKQLKYTTNGNREGRNLLQKVLNARFPLEENNILVRSMEDIVSIHVENSYNDSRVSREVGELLDVQEFVVVPLVAVNRSIGVIVADNKFNRVPISRDSIELLSIFAYQAALSIESYNNLSLVRKEMQKLTDRQEAIVESEKMAAVGRIATHIAHEIRNPLVTMGGYARRIMQLTKEPSKNEEMMRKASKVILNESERLEKVLSNVMDFTRSSPNIREFNNINHVITDTIDLLKNVFQEKHINVDLRLERELPLVKSDFNQMKQVMLNLLQNSLDATAAGGLIEVGTVSNGRFIEIYVKDNGKGINMEEVDQVFEPFFTTKVTGVGLGLAIVRKIVNDHGGEISAHKCPEGGAEFRIRMTVPV